MTLLRLLKKKLPELMHAMTNANVSSAINSQYRSNLLVVRTLANPVTKKSPSDLILDHEVEYDEGFQGFG